MTVESGKPAQSSRLGGRWRRSVWRELARERGRRSEERALAACQSDARPSWIKTARLAASREDHAGIDVVLETDVGRLFLQVKSSEWGRQKFEKRRRKADIAVIVVQSEDDDAKLLAKVSEALGELRAKYRKGRGDGLV
jgi:hypothetical protein